MIDRLHEVLESISLGDVDVGSWTLATRGGLDKPGSAELSPV
jgi:hypothetical protein